MATAPRYAATCARRWRAGRDETGVTALQDRPVGLRDWPTMPTTAGRHAVPWTLHAAFWLVLAESTAESAFVIARDDYGPGGKALVVLAFVAKVGVAHLARRLSAGGVLGLLVFELGGILVAIGADWALGLRLLLVANVVAVYALVLSSLRAFPTPELPRP